MIFATSVLTYLLRYVPMVLVRRLRARPAIERFIKTLPIGILAAIVVQSLFLRGGRIDAGPAADQEPLPAWEPTSPDDFCS
jgi:branched-subunit amino acid transport protein